ncbi:ATP-binding protein [Streptomyces lancefieldiae]|uniref:ATP-binding protein n=1 Tax=Streptomyces lancefieldiae TaxID=3075520 RepID=A0ABU3AWW3_9ACTN|nr:ATP-binding protein [Streptomyces sp. DSM 40712]MDT0614330.1 ATP-binding protein [Streptomyces sp. DSM 40712]
MTSQLPSPIGSSRPTAPTDDVIRTFEMRFTSTPRGARLARRLAAHRLDAWGIPYGTGPHEEIVLVVGELTANAVRHGHVTGRDFHLLQRLSAPARTVRIEVTDTRTERTPPGPETVPVPGAEDTGGRGLLLVAGLATRWGWHLRSGGPGKTVWAECVSEALPTR